MNDLNVTAHGAMAAGCWAVVGICATLAVLSHRIHDTTAERIGLAMVSISSFAAAWRIITAGEVTIGGLWLSVSMAVYVIAIALKHFRDEPTRPPNDKTRPGELT